MERHRIAIIIPAFNEEKTISSVIRKVIPFGDPIVVDDASTDSTVKEATSAQATIVRNITRLGYDDALNKGFAYTIDKGYKIIITFDADGQHDENFLPAFIKAITSGADVVIGVRPSFQRFSEHLFALLTNRLWGISDPLCGMKAYRYEIFKDRGCFDSYGSIGTELTIYAAKSGKNIKNILVNIKPRVDDSRFGRSLLGNLKIFRALLFSILIKY